MTDDDWPGGSYEGSTVVEALQATATAITTMLYIGPPVAAQAHENMIPVRTTNDAITAIKSGKQALLPPGSWAMAWAVLAHFGAPPDHIAFRLKMAGYEAG